MRLWKWRTLKLFTTLPKQFLGISLYFHQIGKKIILFYHCPLSLKEKVLPKRDITMHKITLWCYSWNQWSLHLDHTLRPCLYEFLFVSFKKLIRTVFHSIEYFDGHIFLLFNVSLTFKCRPLCQTDQFPRASHNPNGYLLSSPEGSLFFPKSVTKLYTLDKVCGCFINYVVSNL